MFHYFRKIPQDGILQIVWYYLPARLRLIASNKCHSVSKRISITEKYWAKSFPRRYSKVFVCFFAREKISTPRNSISTVFTFPDEDVVGIVSSEKKTHHFLFKCAILKPFPEVEIFLTRSEKCWLPCFGSFSFIFDRLLAAREHADSWNVAK